MADYVYIFGAANNNEWVIDIQGSSPDSGTPLDAFPQKPDCNDNQQWNQVQSNVLNPGGSGDTYYYFFQSKLNTKNVITANGASVEASEQKSPPSDDQLWEMVNPLLLWATDGLPYYYIQNKKDNNVISIPEGTKNSKTKLQMSSPSGSQNQLWIFSSGKGPFGVQTTP
jgi:hypothetical protein